MRLISFALALALLFSTQMAEARPFDPAPINALRPGETTQEEAIAALGEPDSRMPSLNSHTTLIYEYELEPTSENGNMSNVTIVLLFDPAGRFVRARAYTRE